MKPICLALLVLFFITGWSQGNTDKDFEIIRIKNFAGLTGAENAIKITFPDTVELSKIVYSYSYEKHPKGYANPISDTFKYETTSINEHLPRNLFYKDKPTSTVLNVVSTERRVQFYVERLDPQKKKSEFDWGEDVGQPKIYPYKRQKKKFKKRRYTPWGLKEVTIYAKKRPSWFAEKKLIDSYPRISIENLLFGFAEKSLGGNRVAGNDGINPQLIINHLSNVSFIILSEPSSSDRENCNVIGYRRDGEEDKSLEIPISNETRKNSVNIEFFNKDGYYEEDYLTCKPNIELMFQVPNKIQKPLLEVVDFGFVVRPDTTINVVEHTKPEKVKEVACKHGTKECGSVEIAFKPQQRKTEIYKNRQYKIVNNNSPKHDTLIVIERKPIFKMTRFDTAYITDVQIKAYNEINYWDLEKNPFYNGAIYRRTGNHQINISKLNSGIYDLKVSWELKGIDIDTTIFTSLGDIDINKYEKAMTYIDEIPIDIVDEGGKAEPAFLPFNTKVEEKCLTTNTRNPNPKCKSSLSIPIRRDARYLIVGLDRTELDNEPTKIIGFGRNGGLLDFNVNGRRYKNIGCTYCEQYKENLINWNGSEKNKLDGVLVFDLEKMSGNSISFEAKKLGGDGSVSVFYQYITLTPIEE